MPAGSASKLFAKTILIALYLLGGSLFAAERIAALGFSLQLLLYFGLAGILVACIAAAALVGNFTLRIAYAVIFSASAVFLATVETATGEHLTYDAFINLVNSTGFAGDALRQYKGVFILPLVFALALLAGIAIDPGRFAVRRHVWAAAPLAGILLLSGILFARGGEGARGLPGTFTPLAYASLHLYEGVTGLAGPRAPVSIAIAQPPLRRDIVLIVDESVVASYLDINGPGGVRSGLREVRPALAVHNFGYAAAITNCSVGSNLTLRHGGTRADYRRINATMPSVWAYARRAGLRTVYIDAQRTGGTLHNLMAADERREIQDFVQFDEVPVQSRDMAAADRVAAYLADGRADFIIVNKVGAHFPIHDKYPESHMVHRPALPRGLFGDVADTGSRAGFGGDAEDWRRYRNAYRNTLLWNVGAFFDRLLTKADLSRATLIYTADHGQDLHERGNAGVTTHCSSDPADEEGLVPLVLIEGAGAAGPDWARNLAANRDRSSHYNIFPTLLRLMGYDPGAVAALYGRSLAERTDDPFTFNARFNARLGKRPDWRRIDLRPPARSEQPGRARLARR